MHPDFDENEVHSSNYRLKRVILAPMAHQHKEAGRRQFKRPGDFKPDQISLHGFHELSYLTSQNIHTMTDLFGLDYGEDVANPLTAPSRPVASMSPMPSLPCLPSVPSMLQLPQLPE